VNRPTLAESAPPLADLSLNWVIRLASPKPVMQAEDPAELRVLLNLALHEQDGPLRVDPGGEELRPPPL